MAALRPKALDEAIHIEAIEDELLVYDERRDTAHRLNRTAAVVWQHCDGTRTVDDLVEVLRDEIGEIADEDLVMVTLDELAGNELLTDVAERDREATRLDRRRFFRRVGVVGTAALALPIVHSIVAPEPSAAQTVCSSCFYCSCDYCPCDYCPCSFTTCSDA
jgi:hypothetical protein